LICKQWLSSLNKWPLIEEGEREKDYKVEPASAGFLKTKKAEENATLYNLFFV
jgi:hypothetical protein